MTQYYIVGELSLLLARLQAVAPDWDSRAGLAQLRNAVEVRSPSALGPVVMHAVKMADDMCWTSLERGDEDAFAAQASLNSELFTFATCAGLLDDEEAD